MTWHFPSTDGGDDDGINDAGVEQFNGNKERTIARECIQNSLDARVDYTKPVKVVFDGYYIDNRAIPNYEELSEKIKRAKDYAFGDEKAERFYTEAISCLEGQKVYVLRVSDYNTTGLTGGDTKEDAGGWYHLVRSNGSSYKTIDGGGSFGIGKSAPFVASLIRTVFYSTILEDGSVAFQGKIRISSYKDADGDIHRGIGQFGIQKERGVSSLRERYMIPNIFERSEQGTDVSIIGYKKTDEWKRRIIEAIVESFYVAIYEGALEVTIKTEDEQSIDINAQTLPEIIEQYVTDEEVQLFYKTIIDEKHIYFSDEISGLGQTEMYVRLGEGKRRVQGMRKTLMKIHDFARLKTLNEDYTGVVIVRGEDGNKLLRNLEPPAHDIWDKERGDDISKDALNRLRGWVIDNLRQISKNSQVDVEEIPELSKYLPQDIMEDERDPIFSQGGQSADGFNNNETATERSAEQEQASKITLDIKDRKANISKPGTSGGAEPKIPKHTGRRTGQKGPGGAGEPTGNTQYADLSNMDVKVKESYLGGKRVYILTILPNENDSGDIRIIGYGEGENFPLDIASAHLADGTPLDTKRENIKGLNFIAGQPVYIKVELKSSRRYIVGVA